MDFGAVSFSLLFLSFLFLFFLLPRREINGDTFFFFLEDIQ